MNIVFSGFINLTFIIALYSAMATLLRTKIPYEKVSLYLCTIFIWIYLSKIRIYIDNPFFAIFLTICIFILALSCIFKDNVAKISFSVFLFSILMSLSEMIIVSCCLIVLGNVHEFVEPQFLFLINIIIATLALYLLHIPVIQKKAIQLVEQIGNHIKTDHSIFIISIIFVFCFTYLFYEFMKHSFSILSFVCIHIFLVLLYIYILNEKKRIYQYEVELDMMMDALKRQEELIDRQYLLKHEHTNQLLVLRGFLMHEKDQKYCLGYINQLIKDVSLFEESSDLLKQVSKIPSGGMQGLIYNKLLRAKKENISYMVSTSSDISSQTLKKFNIKEMNTICTLIGIYLDNAIDAAKENESPNIGIYFYKEKDELWIQISNTYKDSIDIQKIYKMRYTTKSKGHGYGLTLAQEIIEHNSFLEVATEIQKNIFSQTIKIKVK